LLKNGDKITIDVNKRVIQADISPEELERRRMEWTAPPYKATSGTLFKFIKNVNSASLGCTTDW
jgi:dihydroxy-acid dehydratase